MMNGNIVYQDSKGLIKNFIKRKNEGNIILVNDLEDKLYQNHHE